MTRPIYEPNVQRALATQAYGQHQLFRRPAPTAGASTTAALMDDIDFENAGDENVAATTWGPDAKPKTLDAIRKVVTLGVACMEQHGAPQREGFPANPAPYHAVHSNPLPSVVFVLASDAVKRGQEALDYYTTEQGWAPDYAAAHAEVCFADRRVPAGDDTDEVNRLG